MTEGKIEEFFNNTFGTIRAIVFCEKIWFVGKDIASALGYADTDQALRRRVFNEYKLTRQIDGSGQKRSVILIDEAGVYQLIFGSKLESAKVFQKWVFEEVLPSIRESGIYIDKDHDKIRSFGINVRLVECKAIQYLIYYARDNYEIDITKYESYCNLSVYADKVAHIPVGRDERENADSINLMICAYVEGIITTIIYQKIKDKEHPVTILETTLRILREIICKIKDMNYERKNREKKDKTKEIAASKIKKFRKARKKSNFEVFNTI